MTLITRSALVAWGHNPPPEVHSVVIHHRGPGGRQTVTWAEVMETRRKRQRERLEAIRTPHHPLRAYKLWVAYFDQNLMGGWHAFLEDYRGAGYRIWIDRDRSGIKELIMKTFPLVEEHASEWKQWHAWKLAFAQHFARRVHDARPCGVGYVWWDGWSTSLMKPAMLPTRRSS